MNVDSRVSLTSSTVGNFKQSGRGRRCYVPNMTALVHVRIRINILGECPLYEIQRSIFMSGLGRMEDVIKRPF